MEGRSELMDRRKGATPRSNFFFLFVCLFHMDSYLYFALALLILHSFHFTKSFFCSPQVVSEGGECKGTVVPSLGISATSATFLFSSIVYHYLCFRLLSFTTTTVQSTFAISQQKEVQCTCGIKEIRSLTHFQQLLGLVNQTNRIDWFGADAKDERDRDQNY